MINPLATGAGSKIIRFYDPITYLPVTIMYNQVFGIIPLFLFFSLVLLIANYFPAGLAIPRLCSSLHFSSLLFCGSCWGTVPARLRFFAPCWLLIPRPVTGPFPWGPVPSLPGIETLLAPVWHHIHSYAHNYLKYVAGNRFYNFRVNSESNGVQDGIRRCRQTNILMGIIQPQIGHHQTRSSRSPLSYGQCLH
jgi:hypothetical protein